MNVVGLSWIITITGRSSNTGSGKWDWGITRTNCTPAPKSSHHLAGIGPYDGEAQGQSLLGGPRNELVLALRNDVGHHHRIPRKTRDINDAGRKRDRTV